MEEELKKVSYFKEFNVNSYETDKNTDLKITCLFQWFSEIAWEHAKMLNLGFEDLNEASYHWVLLGMNVKINKLPKWQDYVKLQTWPSGVSDFYFGREFILYDNNNEILAAASSSWLIYNELSLRPVIPNTSKMDSYKINSHKAAGEEFTKLRPHKNLIPQQTIIAQYTDIDMHQHVNNAVYIKWIENYLGREPFFSRISNVKIQYIKEVKQNDEIIIYFATDDNKLYCEAILTKDNKTSFRAEIVF